VGQSFFVFVDCGSVWTKGDSDLVHFFHCLKQCNFFLLVFYSIYLYGCCFLSDWKHPFLSWSWHVDNWLLIFFNKCTVAWLLIPLTVNLLTTGSLFKIKMYHLPCCFWLLNVSSGVDLKSCCRSVFTNFHPPLLMWNWWRLEKDFGTG